LIVSEELSVFCGRGLFLIPFFILHGSLQPWSRLRGNIDILEKVLAEWKKEEEESSISFFVV
jgi:hypothetical protein